jgi:hypothetical protein
MFRQHMKYEPLGASGPIEGPKLLSGVGAQGMDCPSTRNLIISRHERPLVLRLIVPQTQKGLVDLDL